jgi:hypothetical protein
MTHEPLDALRQKMIAALYGELCEEEERELKARLAEDAELRADWDELQTARDFLKSAETEEPVPSFVFLGPPEDAADRSRAGSASGPASLPHGRRLWDLVRSPVAGFALAAAALVILIVAGLRVDQTHEGLVLGFGPAGEPARREMPAPATEIPALAEGSSYGTPLVPGAGRPAASTQPEYGGTISEPSGLSASDLDGYLTHAEFVAYAREINGLMQSMLSDQEDRRRAELAYVAHGLFDEMSSQHRQEYDELNGQIQQVWLGLVDLGTRDASWRQSVPGQGERYGARPVYRSPNQND